MWWCWYMLLSLSECSLLYPQCGGLKWDKRVSTVSEPHCTLYNKCFGYRSLWPSEKWNLRVLKKRGFHFSLVRTGPSNWSVAVIFRGPDFHSRGGGVEIAYFSSRAWIFFKRSILANTYLTKWRYLFCGLGSVFCNVKSEIQKGESLQEITLQMRHTYTSRSFCRRQKSPRTGCRKTLHQSW